MIIKFNYKFFNKLIYIINIYQKYSLLLDINCEINHSKKSFIFKYISL